MSFFSSGTTPNTERGAITVAPGTVSGLTMAMHPSPPGAQEADVPLSLREMMSIIRRRATIIGYSFVLIMIPGVAFTLLQPPTFRSTAKLVLENMGSTVSAVDASNPLSALFAASERKEIATEVQVLQSVPLRRAVQAKLGNNRPFDLTVARVDQTNVITITAEAGDPKTTQRIPELLIHTYLEQDKQSSLHELSQSKDFINEELTAAQDTLNKSERDLEAFKKRKNVAGSAQEREAGVSHLAALRAQEETARGALDAAISEVTFLRSKKAAEPTVSIAQLPTVNPATQEIQQEIRKLRIEDAQLASTLTPSATKRIELREQIAFLNAQLKKEPVLSSVTTSQLNPVRQDIDRQIAVAEARAVIARTELQTSIAQRKVAEQQTADYPAQEFVAERLNRARETAKQTIELLAGKRVDITLREKAYRPSARLMESAELPQAPVKPRRAQNIVVLTIFGLMVGLGFALLLEYLDDRINSVEEGNRVLGLPSLGSVPKLSAGDFKLLSAKNGFRTAESYRILRTNIHFAAVDHPIHTLLVTSSDPGEGKTTTALNLAQAFALDGRRVILVDTDLRRPTLHLRVNENQMPGLTDVLVDAATVADVLRPQADVPGLQVITAGSIPPNPSELLGSRRFLALLDELHKQADMVILDSSPLLVAADASLLSAIADGVLLILESGKTRKGSARRALDHLRHARAHVLGVAYNKVLNTDVFDYYYTPYYGYTSSTDTPRNGGSLPDKSGSPTPDAYVPVTSEPSATISKNGHAKSHTHDSSVATLERNNEDY